MVLRIRLTHNENKEFLRVFEIYSEKTFYEFHSAIQKELGYDKGHLASFFLCDQEWDRKEEITLMDMGYDLVTKMPIHKMQESIIEDFMDEEGQRMAYLFDYFSDRSFHLELIESIEDDVNEPLMCIERNGTPPPQTLMVDEFGDLIRHKDQGKKRNKGIDSIPLDDQDDYFGEEDEFDELSDIENLDKLAAEDDDDDY